MRRQNPHPGFATLLPFYRRRADKYCPHRPAKRQSNPFTIPSPATAGEGCPKGGVRVHRPGAATHAPREAGSGGGVRILLIALPLLILFAGVSHAAPTRQVQITSVAVNYDSVKVDFAPVPGAKDYRIFEASNPRDVKYAGVWHLDAPSGQHFAVDGDGHPLLPPKVEQNGPNRSGPGHIDIPALEVEWNGLMPHQPTTLVVEAVNQIGPAPRENCTCKPASGTVRGALDPSGRYSLMPMYGSNAGPIDGPGGSVWEFATNGQGPSSDRPAAVARSLPFVVTATGHPTLPSSADSTQVFFDSFPDQEQMAIRRVGPVDAVLGKEKFLMGRWTIQYDGADTLDSYPFVMNNHFMDVLFDGGTPNTNMPLHNNHSLMAMSPDQFADFSGERILHITMEVDGHVDGRRWVGFALAPANDPIETWYPSDNVPINKTDRAFFVEIHNNVVTANLYAGRRQNGFDNHISIAAAAGQGNYMGYRLVGDCQYGRGLDNRSRFDLYVSEKHFAVFEDGRKIYDYNFPTPLPFAKAKIYYTHYLYHTGNEILELRQYTPCETFWIADMPWSAERHWDNMGLEVLPAGGASSGWGDRARLSPLPPASAPRYIASADRLYAHEAKAR